VIDASGVVARYGSVVALDDVSLRARRGRMLGLIGPNGSGKTSLLRVLHGVVAPAAGKVVIDGVAVSTLTRREIARRIAVVSQDTEDGLSTTVAELTLLGRSPHRRSLERYGTEDHRVAAWALERVGALAYAARPLSALSGGERQRVLIARALCQSAEHLLLDEPINHLDVRYQHEILSLVRSLGLTTVVVLHDIDLAARYCDDLVLLDRGRVVAAGEPDGVLDPDVLERVYGLRAQRRDDEDGVRVVFRPAHDSGAKSSHAGLGAPSA
jgi:iron complex transport system ATP-binding protein